MAQHSDQKLSSLQRDDQNVVVSKNHTLIVKLMRVGLPLIAVGLMAVIIIWPQFDKRIVPLTQEQIATEIGDNIGKNELLNPVYNTTDANQNPVKVTADKAIVSQNNQSLIRLEKPNANFKTNGGEALQVESLQGTYDEKAEKLYLQDDVKITHEKNYTLNAQELRVNIKTQEAFSDKDVTINGPEATINAKGLSGNVEEGLLIFPGPAKLTLTPQSKNGVDEPQLEEKIEKVDTES